MKKAFTMLELIFVIVVIGILSSVALPKFAGAGNSAYMAKAKNTLAIVRSAISTERQRRILAGMAGSDITALNMGADGKAGSNVFDHFSKAGSEKSGKPVIDTPISKCLGKGAVACWQVGKNNKDYTYVFPDGSGNAKFILRDNRLDCKDNAGAAECAKISN